MNSKEELLDEIEEIGTIKRKLSLKDRALTSGYGLYVQSGRLPGGAMQYMAGGRLLKKLVFVREADGTRTVKKYHPGDWERKVDEILSLCRALERASEGQTEWTDEKFEAYWAEETFDPTLITKVNRVWNSHFDQLNEVWHKMSLEKWEGLKEVFRNELEQEWPTEYIEMRLRKSAGAVLEQVGKGIKTAYLVGYMVGKGWISVEEAANWNLWLGNLVVDNIRSKSKGAQSRGTAFASAFVRVAAEATKVALGGDMQAYEPSKYEILNEILLREGTKLIGKSIKHPELLGQSTLSVSVDPFNPSDSEYLTRAFLGGPSHMGHFDTERLETILKKLLQDEYDGHYEAAKQRIISSH